MPRESHHPGHDDRDSLSRGADTPAQAERPPRGHVQHGIADDDKRVRCGDEAEDVRNTPPAGKWNDVA